jgi:transposase
MEGSIRLSVAERKVLLRVYRSGSSTHRARHAHILLLLDDGHSYRLIHEFLYASYDLIASTVRRYREEGLDAIVGPPTTTEATVPLWMLQIVKCLTTSHPEDFGYLRRRWTCAMLREVLFWETKQHVTAEQVRCGLRKLKFVWRRPRPVVGLLDPEFEQKLVKIQDLLAALPRNETAVFQDEVDVHLNPKIGSMWMRRGEQAEVWTPGNNEKRHLAGSLDWRTGRLFVSEPSTRRNAELFVRHLNDLRCRLRTYRVIHVICDNARFHDCRLVQAFLRRWGHRVRLHYLPKYAPESNPIERVWWHLHETVTRNHRCQSMEQLLADVYRWIEERRNFMIETSLYQIAA